jgi:hypothetical protein
MWTLSFSSSGLGNHLEKNGTGKNSTGQDSTEQNSTGQNRSGRIAQNNLRSAS